jgi:hypothetical protein
VPFQIRDIFSRMARLVRPGELLRQAHPQERPRILQTAGSQ